MELIGQNQNKLILDRKIEKFHLDNKNIIRIILKSKNKISPSFLAKYIVSKLGIDAIYINCFYIRSIQAFQLKLSKVSKNTILVLNNYELLKKPIRDYFETFINRKYKNKRINDIRNTLSIIIILNKNVKTSLLFDSLKMENYSFNELYLITKSLLRKLNISENDINVNSLLSVKDAYDPKFIYKQLLTFLRYEELSSYLKVPYINYHNFLKIKLLTNNVLTIIDCMYLVMINNQNSDNNNIYDFNNMNLFHENKALNGFILTYLALKNLIYIKGKEKNITFKGKKILMKIKKSKTIINHFNYLDFALHNY